MQAHLWTRSFTVGAWNFPYQPCSTIRQIPLSGVPPSRGVGSRNTTIDILTKLGWCRCTLFYYTAQDHKSVIKHGHKTTYNGATLTTLHILIVELGMIETKKKSFLSENWEHMIFFRYCTKCIVLTNLFFRLIYICVAMQPLIYKHNNTRRHGMSCHLYIIVSTANNNTNGLYIYT
jgi:hypothetical protein